MGSLVHPEESNYSSSSLTQLETYHSNVNMMLHLLPKNAAEQASLSRSLFFFFFVFFLFGFFFSFLLLLLPYPSVSQSISISLTPSLFLSFAQPILSAPILTHSSTAQLCMG